MPVSARSTEARSSRLPCASSTPRAASACAAGEATLRVRARMRCPFFDELPGDGSSLGSGRAGHEYVEWLGHEASWYELDIKMLDVKKRIRYRCIHIHGLESSASGAAATHTFAYGGTT